MIVPEYNIRAIVDTIPAVRINNSLSKKPSFMWGDKAQLAKYLKVKKDAAYPLIWLLKSPKKRVGNGQQMNKNCVFIIAQKETRQDMFNDERFEKAFDTVLNPLTDNLIHGLDVSTISNLLDRDDIDIDDFPNYVEADKNYTIDLWDAVQLTISVRFNNTSDCLKAISYD